MKRTTRIAAAIVIVILSLSACAPAAPQQEKSVADTFAIEQTGETIQKKESKKNDNENPIVSVPTACEMINESSESTPQGLSKTEKVSVKGTDDEPTELKLKPPVEEKEQAKPEEISAPEPTLQPQPEAKPELARQVETPKPKQENESKPAPEPPIELDLDVLCRYAIDYAVETYGYEYWPGMRDGYYPAATFQIETMEQGQQRASECVDDLTQELEARGEPIVAYVDGIGYGMPFDIEIQPDPDGYTDSYIIQLYY